MADKDGIAKNVDKLKTETAKMVDAVKAENAKGTHDPVTNAFVEGARASPYAFGHYALFAAVILVGIIVALVVL